MQFRLRYPLKGRRSKNSCDGIVRSSFESRVVLMPPAFRFEHGFTKLLAVFLKQGLNCDGMAMSVAAFPKLQID